MIRRTASLIATATLLAANLALAEPTRLGDLILETPWTRATPPAAKVAGGYLTITNAGDAADRLVGGDAAFAERVEIHEMAMADGVMRMRPLEEGLAVAPGETVTLEPGGYHLMLMGLSAPLTQGETVEVTLRFAEAGEVTVTLDVAAIGAGGPPTD